MRFNYKKVDFFLILGCGFLAISSFCIDSVFALGIPLSSNSPNILSRLIYTLYAKNTDFLLISMPLFLRIQTVISTFIFGPLNVLFVYGLIKKKNWIRIPILMYAASMIYGMFIVFGVTFLGDFQTGNLIKYLSFTLPYLIIPMVLAWRVRKKMVFPEIKCK